MKFFAEAIADTRTERLALRPLRRSDAETMFAMFNDWCVVRLLSSPPWPYTLEDAEGFISQAMNPIEEDTEFPFAIMLKDALIGCIGVRMRPASHLQRASGPNIGYWLGRPYWGNGYMTEAALGIIRQIFATHPDNAIYCGAFTENVASLRVQEKLGFVRESETMLHSRPRGGDFPHVNTVLTRSRFESFG